MPVQTSVGSKKGWPKEKTGSAQTTLSLDELVINSSGRICNFNSLVLGLEAMGGHQEKLLVGVSLKLGGYEWRCRTDQRLSPTLDKGTWRSLAECESRARDHTARWDEAQKSPWYSYPDGDAFVQGWFNNAHAWQVKLNWIKEQGLGGLGMWVLDGVNDLPVTWELLRQYLSGKPTNSLPEVILK
jgi:GH18 family chitinase